METGRGDTPTEGALGSAACRPLCVNCVTFARLIWKLFEVGN